MSRFVFIDSCQIINLEHIIRVIKQGNFDAKIYLSDGEYIIARDRSMILWLQLMLACQLQS